jgi:hypothetical protein
MIARCRLSSSVPFDMVLPKRSANILSRLAKEDLKAVARYKDYFLFDFGDLRAFSLATSQSRFGSVEVGGYFRAFEGAFELIELPTEFKCAVQRAKTAALKGKTLAVEIRLDKATISLVHAGAEEAFDLKTPYHHSFNFLVNPVRLAKVVKRARFMGFRSRDHPMYFRNDTCEYLLQTSTILSNKEG